MLTDLLIAGGLDFIIGVPCSIFKDFLEEVARDGRFTWVHASDEAEAVGVATGYYLATGKPAVVYMQNSGLGNAIDLLTSLTNEEMYAVPMLLLISWRGKENDAVQHRKMGRIMLPLLEVLDIPVYSINSAIKSLSNKPIAVVFEKGSC